jgi:8-oxo-dGTP diphosphatase
MMDLRPRIGVGVLVFREGKLLLGRRKGSHGAGFWSAPGGHLEFGETPEQCARRETLEETGLCLELVHPGPWVNDIFTAEQKHYVTLFCLAESKPSHGDPINAEPEKCEGWDWFDYDQLPQPLFQPLDDLIKKWEILAI